VPGTVFAAFSVSEEATTLFLVERERPVRAFRLEIPLKELQARVSFVLRSASGGTGGRAEAMGWEESVRVEAGRTLFQKLFPADARPALAAAKRIVLSPDGALWDLPFAALVTNDEGKPQYLGLQKPLLYAQSLSLFARSAAAPVEPTAGSVLVVGNPLFDNARRAEVLALKQGQPPARPGPVLAASRDVGELAVLSREGTTPAPLPDAEREAREVGSLYGVAASSGVEPTESWFRERAGNARVIHLATHGYFNPHRAMSSGLRLAVPESQAAGTDDDGALQAWEIMSQLRLKAELVVLSACETGVGEKIRGEGLVGLTRAFQVAGARSIVASQWRVSDQSTAALMVAFHRNLRAGQAKDEALRAAMARVAADPALSHPYFWAPFLIVGDPRPLGPEARGR
jgi:CHAT domain-containing protein